MACEWGNRLRVEVFGRSHGEAVGCLVTGLPVGESVDMERLRAFLARRRPGRSPLSTTRSETDEPRFISGLANGKTCSGPLCILMDNADAKPADYAELADKPRPGHADYTAWRKWQGNAEMSGGGRFSGRLTAPLCAAGGIAAQILSRRGVAIGAHLREVAGIRDADFPLWPENELFEQIAARDWPVIDETAGVRMRAAVAEAREAGDSVGGVIECAVNGAPAGLGDALFDGVESRMSAVLFGIPGVKGVEFGLGFEAARVRGSINNDPFTRNAAGEIVTTTNHCGGILGGITDGMPIVFRVAVKPTPSIAIAQKTVRLSDGSDAELRVHGRHDPCFAHRAVPVVEAVAALVVLDLMLEGV